LHQTKDGKFLNNTYLQTLGLAEAIRRQPEAPTNILLETLEYHLKRVKRTAEAYGLRANFVVAEDILHEHGITDYDQAFPVIARGTRKTEALAYLLTSAIGDGKGTLMNKVMGKAGARLVDVVEDSTGDWIFVNTMASKKLAALKARAGQAQHARAA
jgi:hypothetical protein